MKPVTIWMRFYPDTETKKAHWEFNHLEDGHVDTEKPNPKYDSQKQWASFTWMKRFGYLDSRNKVVEACESTGEP